MRCCRGVVVRGLENVVRGLENINSQVPRKKILMFSFPMAAILSGLIAISNFSTQNTLEGEGCEMAEIIIKDPHLWELVRKNEEVGEKGNDFLQAKGRSSCKDTRERQEVSGNVLAVLPLAFALCGLTAACCVPARRSEESLNAEAPAESQIMNGIQDVRFTESFLEKCSLDKRFKDYLCPISRAVFTNPVVASDGHTYDYNYLVPLYSTQTNPPSPLNRSKLGPLNEVIPNYTIRSLLSQLLEEAFKEFKDEEADVRRESQVALTDAIEPTLIGITV